MFGLGERLTPDQVASYNRDGFLLIDDFFALDELEEINREIDRLRGVKTADNANQGDLILRLGLKSEMTRSLCRDERILTLIENIVKPGIAIYSAKLFEKRPNDAMICHWHQDDAYYQQNSLCACRMSVWIPLQDCDETNGCLWVLPGSHWNPLKSAAMIGDNTGHCELAFAHGTTEIEGAIPVRWRRAPSCSSMPSPPTDPSATRPIARAAPSSSATRTPSRLKATRTSTRFCAPLSRPDTRIGNSS